MGLLKNILSYSTPGILINSISSAVKGEVPKAVTITQPARDSFLKQYGLSGVAKAASGDLEYSGKDAFALVSGTVSKPVNPTVSPSTGSKNPTIVTPGINPNEPMPVLFDDVTNHGLNPLWLLALLVLFLIAKAKRLL